jgi:hypothetical protein
MASIVRAQFRPTIILFVGASGANICAHLRTLGRLLPEELNDGVALIEVDEPSFRARLHTGIRADTDARDGLALAEALHPALRAVQGERTVRAIQQAGHAVPVSHAQIYVVGHTTAQTLPDVIDHVRAALADPPIAANITFLLSDMPQDQDALPRWRERLFDHDDMPHVDFCYLYEELGHHHTFHRQEDIEYAAAEALFALSATAVPAVPVVQQATARSLGVTDVDARIGSLGTSLILFPRPEAERYCTDLLAAELMQTWTESRALAERSETYRERASDEMETIFGHLADGAERPGADGPPWPSLASLIDDRQAAQLERRTVELFAPFDYDRVADEAARSGDGWRAVAQRREGAAIIAFHVWEQVARSSWQAAGDAIAKRVAGAVDELWLAEGEGAPAALAYVQRIDEGVQLLRERLIAWRVAHANTYARDLADLDLRSQGPWMLESGPTAAAVAASAGSLRLEASRLPANEQDLVARMERRVAWAEDRLPPWLNLIAVCLMACPPLILLTLDALPHGWGVQAFPAILVALIVGTLAAAVCWTLRRHAESKVIAARQDLLAVFRRYYAYRCERREDELRVVILGPFHRRVSRMCERLEHMQHFVATVRQGLLDDAAHTRDALFDGAAGHRDVYVANGERLTKDGAYTLDSLYAEVTRRRQITAEQSNEWHRSADRMVATLRRWLSERETSVLDMPDAAVESAIREFSAGVVRAYLVGDLVDLEPALAAKGERRKVIWREALRRSHVLFRPKTSPQPSLFVGGVDPHRAALEGASPHPDAVHIRTSHPDWLLVAQFCPGGALTKWSDTPRDALPHADADAQESNQWSVPRQAAVAQRQQPTAVNQPRAGYGAVSQPTRPKGR